MKRSVLPERLIDLHLFEHQLLQHRAVAPAVGLCNLSSQFTLAAFEPASFESMERIFHL